MHSATIYAALAALTCTLVDAHGKIAVVTGDAGGNTTALGIQGGVIPGAGPNGQTEKDTTVFRSRNIATDGLGRTKGQGPNSIEAMSNVVAMSGSTLPQVSSNGGYISGTYHVVTTDGAGPVRAIVDPTGTGQFSQGTEADVVTQIPGKGGNIAPGPLSQNLPQGGKGGGSGGLLSGLGLRGLRKRALNVDADYPLKVAIPAGTTCSGTMGGMSNVCLLKVANSNGAGPFGGVIAFQMAGSNSTAAGGSTTGGSGNNAAGNSANDQGEQGGANGNGGSTTAQGEQGEGNSSGNSANSQGEQGGANGSQNEAGGNNGNGNNEGENNAQRNSGSRTNREKRAIEFHS